MKKAQIFFFSFRMKFLIYLYQNEFVDEYYKIQKKKNVLLSEIELSKQKLIPKAIRVNKYLYIK